MSIPEGRSPYTGEPWSVIADSRRHVAIEQYDALTQGLAQRVPPEAAAAMLAEAIIRLHALQGTADPSTEQMEQGIADLLMGGDR
ncbi:hypothetical protein ACWESM_18740 [Nocardia sp. NPDC003999]